MPESFTRLWLEALAAIGSSSATHLLPPVPSRRSSLRSGTRVSRFLILVSDFPTLEL